MNKKKKKRLLIAAAIAAVIVAVLVWYYFFRDKDDFENYTDNYIVLDLCGPPEWLASQNRTAIWKDKIYPLPMVFKIVEASPTNRQLYGFTTAKDGRKLLTIADNPIDIASLSFRDLSVLTTDSTYLDDVNGRSATVTIKVFAPKGADKKNYNRPDDNTLRSLLTSSNVYFLTQGDWPDKTLNKHTDIPDNQTDAPAKQPE